MNTSIINFDYKGNQISFERGKDVMVNLTSMAKPFPEKNLTQIVNSQEISDYCNSLSKLQNHSLADLLIVRRGGNNKGTWAHRLVAIRVAQKLNSDFAVWVDLKINELFFNGVATISSEDEIIARSISILQTRLDQKSKEIKLLEQKSKDQEQKIIESAPKVIFADAVSTSAQSCLVAELAKILQQKGINIGQNRLFSRLRECGYLCIKGEYYNQPTQKGMDLGLFELKKTTITKPDGNIIVRTTTKVTGKGQIYFTNKFLTGKIMP